MTDGFSVVNGIVSTVGVIFGVIATIATIRATGAQRFVERSQGASALLANLDTLPADQSSGSRIVPPGQEDELRVELSRIVRENAAIFATQHPSPVGFDFARVLMAAYAVFFGGFGIHTMLVPGVPRDSTAGLAMMISGAFWLVLGFMAAVVCLVLFTRMQKRNAARRLAGTPGTETYFGPVREVVELVGRSRWWRCVVRQATRPWIALLGSLRSPHR